MIGASYIMSDSTATVGAATCNRKFHVDAIPEYELYNSTESKFIFLSHKNGTTFEIEFLCSLKIAAPDKYEKVCDFLGDIRMDLSPHEVQELLKV